MMIWVISYGVEINYSLLFPCGGGRGLGELLALGTKLILICVILYVLWGFCLPSADIGWYILFTLLVIKQVNVLVSVCEISQSLLFFPLQGILVS